MKEYAKLKIPSETLLVCKDSTMNRVLGVGICGAGKSTFATKLAKKINLPLYHLDKMYWKENWTESEMDDFRARVSKVASEGQWIIEGNYGSTYDLRFPRADTIFVLDYSQYLAMFRATKRIITNYKKTRSDMAPNCPERFDWDFYKFMWNFPKRNKPKLEEALIKYASDKKIIRFKNPNELERYWTNEYC